MLYPPHRGDGGGVRCVREKGVLLAYHDSGDARLVERLALFRFSGEMGRSCRTFGSGHGVYPAAGSWLKGGGDI